MREAGSSRTGKGRGRRKGNGGEEKASPAGAPAEGEGGSAFDGRDDAAAREEEDRWWVYLLECEGGRLYTGIARDPARRFREHASGKGARFTRSFRPVRLLAVLPCEGRSAATRIEIAAKALPAREKRAFFHAGTAKEDDGREP